ncbi:hypothetical protein ILUMI_04343 [Ignelater luminosus]|uniref:O-acyltransferase WSD1 C-terminal domain-containing protein n=1 Tax=Ignelater luminosus TaxID=2038154 RepID=A0A8K0GJ46_IGNLU|nr:hypothetical protein ILUMI_04343 [Ignelater luminosus]
MVRCEKYTSEEFYEICKTVMLKASLLKRFYASFCNFFGYTYMIKQELDVLNDCMGKMKTVDCPKRRINKSQLYKLLNYHSNAPMPKSGKIVCQILIGTQPVDWNNDNCDYYPVVFKIHHAVSDGIALLKTFVAVIADKLEVSEDPINSLKSFKQEKEDLFVNNQLKMFINGLEKLKMFLLIITLYPSLAVAYFTYKANDTNILHNTSLKQQTLIGINAEKSTNCIQPPQYITIAIPINVNAAELPSLRPGDVTIDDMNLSNSYSLVLLRLPIAVGNDKKSEFPANSQVIKRVKLINQEIDILKNSFEYQINLFFMQVVCAIFPQFFIKLILDRMHCTTVASIFAGPPKMTYDNRKLVLTDIIAWIAHMHNTGTSLGIITYDDRLHVAVNVDKALISDQNDVQRIADDIYKYLDILEKEVEAYSTGDL